MSINFLKFSDTEIKKRKFHSSKSSVAMDDADISKILTYINISGKWEKKWF